MRRIWRSSTQIQRQRSNFKYFWNKHWQRRITWKRTSRAAWKRVSWSYSNRRRNQIKSLWKASKNSWRTLETSRHLKSSWAKSRSTATSRRTKTPCWKHQSRVRIDIWNPAWDERAVPQNQRAFSRATGQAGQPVNRVWWILQEVRVWPSIRRS